MNGRIALVRKELGYKQDDFAEKIGLTKNFISLIETGKREPSDRTIKDICREFNVNEEWLRNGTGEMFIEMDKEDLLMEWAGRVLGSRSSSFKKNFVKMMMSLTEDEWEMLERKARELVNYEDEE